ncbi:hypothetical protein PX554_10260 [Sphingomonas sp. H39-1-10]|uniref:hypothetical protein n=1 Tax=Sphingomonas pollutisoli TaxID=3030829 RepID=UPI0023B9C046|nr:hypothetical protein [Sphingomonas pollutisoli]MDF0488513.1 hypothetical protein [Sphingomonas pollutisoli]
MSDLSPPPMTTQELRIVDAQGHPRILMSAKDGVPTIVLVGLDGKPGATVALDAANRPSVTLTNPDPALPSAALAIDDKGAHVKFDRPGGASSYLFLNNQGVSGVVLIDAAGRRRLDATVAADGTPTIERRDAAGAPLP